MENCKKPLCVYNKKTKKCVKPNGYIEWLKKCGMEKSMSKCKDLYVNNPEKHKKNACDYYEENTKRLVNKKTCPKARRPINNTCSKEYSLLKKNKNGEDCCYKEKQKIKVIKKHIEPKKLNKSDIFLNFSLGNKTLNDNGKIPNIHKKKRYANKKIPKRLF